MPRDRQFTKPSTKLPDKPEPQVVKRGLTPAELGLDALSFGASGADELSTEKMLKNPANYEIDPLAKPLVGLPKPAYMATGAAMDLGLAALGHHMRNSDRPWERKIWFVPQLAQTAIQAGLAAHNMGLPGAQSPPLLGKIPIGRRLP
jgi:hypothetical protein